MRCLVRLKSCVCVCVCVPCTQDRRAEDGIPTPEQLLAEKASLADEHVLVVLGALHAQIKALWAFKVGAHKQRL